MSDSAVIDKNWCDEVCALILDGWGYDDIALKLGCTGSLVRLYAKELQQAGKLDELVLSGKKIWTELRLRGAR